MSRRRRKFRRIRYVPRKRVRKNPGMMNLLILGGLGVVGFFLYKKWKEKKALPAAPTKTTVKISGSGGEISMPALDLRVGAGSLGTGEFGSLS